MIGELQKLGAIGWALWPGAFFVPMMIGLFFVANDICDTLKLHKYWTLGLLQLMSFGVAFSRLASGQSDANFIETPFTLGIYSISMGIGIIGLLFGFLHARLKRNTETFFSIESTVWIKIFLVVWCLGMLVSMRAAVRFTYLFTVPCTILGSYALLWSFKRWIPQDKRSWLYALYAACILWQVYALFVDRIGRSLIFVSIYVLLGCVTFLIVLLITRSLTQRTLKRQFAIIGLAVYLIALTALSPHIALGGYAFQVRNGLPVPLLAKDRAVKKALTWIQGNTDTDAVIAAHWEYGSWLNLLSNRPTIVDEQQRTNWTHLMAKQVFVANNDIQGALEFLKTHQADYLLLTQRDIRHRGNICKEASATNNMSIPVFGNVVQKVHFVDKVTGAVHNSYRYWLPEWQSAVGGYDLTLGTETYPSNTWYISSIYVQFEASEEGILPIKAIVELNLNGTVKYLPPEYLYYGDTILCVAPQNPFLPCTIIIDSGGSVDPMQWHLVYLSPDVCALLLIRLFLLDDLGYAFERVYPPADSGDVEDFGVQVWKIHYPDNIEAKPEYLQINTLAPTHF